MRALVDDLLAYARVGSFRPQARARRRQRAGPPRRAHRGPERAAGGGRAAGRARAPARVRAAAGQPAGQRGEVRRARHARRRSRVRAEREAEHWRFEVADNGIGIPPPLAERSSACSSACSGPRTTPARASAWRSPEDRRGLGRAHLGAPARGRRQRVLLHLARADTLGESARRNLDSGTKRARARAPTLRRAVSDPEEDHARNANPHPHAQCRRRPVEPERRRAGPGGPHATERRTSSATTCSPSPSSASGSRRRPSASSRRRSPRASRSSPSWPTSRLGHARVGDGARRDPLHALVPAADRLHGREARLVLRAHGRRQRDRRVRRQGAHPGRAGRVLVPHRRHPGDVRGARLHRLGPVLAGVHPREPQRRAALHPDGVHVVDGRGARPQDPAAALDGRAVALGHPRAAAAGRRRRDARVHHGRPRAGVLPDRRAVLLRAPRPRDHGPHAVRRQAAEGP